MLKSVHPPCEGARGRSSQPPPKRSKSLKQTNMKPIYHTADVLHYKTIRKFREKLKEQPTKAEEILWRYLKSCKTGYKFRRQHVIDHFIADFVCLSHKLIVEVDGKIHLQQAEKDQLRTFALNEKGYKVIRFTNEEVYQHPALFVQQIREVLAEMDPQSK